MRRAFLVVWVPLVAGQTSVSAQEARDQSPSLSVALPAIVVQDEIKAASVKKDAAKAALSPASQIIGEAEISDPTTVAGPPLGAAASSSFSGDQLNTSLDHRVDSLLQAIPNSNISGFGDGRSSLITFRGVGPLTDPFAPDDNTVVTYIDGIPQLLFASDASLIDLDRVDVFKGPQGTRFGWNSTGGAIDYITRKPGDGREASLRTEIGEQGHLFTEVTGSSPASGGDSFARVAVRYSDIDGYVPNIATGNDVGAREVAAARATVLLKPSADTKVTVAARGENDRRTLPYFLARGEQNFPIAYQSIDGMTDRTQAGGSLIIERKLEESMFTSLSGFSGLSINSRIDDTDGILFSRITGLAPALFAFDGTATDWKESETLWSQELRLASPRGRAVDWVAGISVLQNHFEADYRNTHAIFAVNNGRRLNDLETTSLGAFGEVTVPATATTRMTGGVRLNHDRKGYDSRYLGNGFPGTVDAFTEEGALTYTYLTGRMSLTQDLDRWNAVVATVSRGEKSGGFPRLVTNAALGVETTPFRPTKVMAYELGLRQAAPRGTGSLASSVFFNDVTDEQLFVFDAANFSFVPDNMDTQSYGAELQGDWQIVASLKISGGFGVTVAEIKNLTPQQRAAGAREGNRPTNTPDLTAFARIDYRREITLPGIEAANPALTASLGWSYIGARAANVANDFFLRDLHLIDGRVGISTSPGCEMYVFGRNLLGVIPERAGNFVGNGVEAVVPERGRVAGVGLVSTW